MNILVFKNNDNLRKEKKTGTNIDKSKHFKIKIKKKLDKCRPK